VSLSVQHSIALSFRKFVERRHVGAMVLGSRGRGAGWGSLLSTAQGQRVAHWVQTRTRGGGRMLVPSASISSYHHRTEVTAAQP
jgi:hypothetical protein